MLNKRVDILLATFNGSAYLEEQLESILRQSYTNWTMKIRDDGSTDASLSILKSYVKKDSRISILKDDYGNLRSCQNFARLMNDCSDDTKYVMFCDQDDIWLPSKIETTLNSIIDLEEEYGYDTCLLTYGTYKLMDEKGNLIPIKVPDYSKKPKLNLLLNQNYVYGCTMMVNKKLLQKSLPIPLSAENHDYWIALTATANNAKIAYIETPLLWYRQHYNNVSGSYKNASFSNRLQRLSNTSELTFLRQRAKMASSLLDINKHRIDSNKRILISKFVKNIEAGGIKTFIFCVKNNFHRIKLSSTITFYINLLRSIYK